MKQKTIIVFLIIAFLLVFFIAFLNKDRIILNRNELIHIQEKPISFRIVEERIISLNTGNDSLDFGRIMRGNTVDKDITIINPFKIRVKVFVDFSGGISNFTRISENNFTLGIDNKKKINLKIIIPKNSTIGNYNGSMIVKMFRE